MNSAGGAPGEALASNVGGGDGSGGGGGTAAPHWAHPKHRRRGAAAGATAVPPPICTASSVLCDWLRCHICLHGAAAARRLLPPAAVLPAGGAAPASRLRRLLWARRDAVPVDNYAAHRQPRHEARGAPGHAAAAAYVRCSFFLRSYFGPPFSTNYPAECINVGVRNAMFFLTLAVCAEGTIAWTFAFLLLFTAVAIPIGATRNPLAPDISGPQAILAFSTDWRAALSYVYFIGSGLLRFGAIHACQAHRAKDKSSAWRASARWPLSWSARSPSCARSSCKPPLCPAKWPSSSTKTTAQRPGQGFSTQGMRIQNENSGSHSLFAHPMAIEAIPEMAGNREQGIGNSPAETEPTAASETLIALKGHDFSRAINDATTAGALAPEECSSESAPPATDQPAKPARGLLEARMEAALTALAEYAEMSPTLRQGHLALLKRWYYRPEARRAGEIFFPTPKTAGPSKPSCAAWGGLRPVGS